MLESGPPRRTFGAFVTSLDPRQRRDLAIGCTIALVVLALPFTRFVFGILGVLIHELGHSLVAWLFGIPAIPSLDFVHGGGWSLQGRRSTFLQLAWFAALAAAAWYWRGNRPTLIVLGAVGLTWAVIAATFLHEVAIAGAGHAFELLFGGIFLYRGLTGSGCRLDVERPLSVAVGAFLTARTFLFAAGVATDSGERARYEAGKAGVVSDLHAVALDLHARLAIPIGTDGIATILLIAALATPGLAWLAVAHRERWQAALATLLDRG